MRYILFAVLFLLALAFVIIIAVAWCTTTVKVVLHNKNTTISIKCLFIKYSIELPKNKKSDKGDGKPNESEDEKKEKPRYLEVLRESKNIILEICEHLKGRISIILSMDLTFGTGDPAKTGILYGWIWNIIGIFYPIISSYFVFEFPDFEIKPDFYNKCFDIKAESIIKLRCAHIINTLIVVGIKNRKYLKSLKQAYKNKE